MAGPVRYGRNLGSAINILDFGADPSGNTDSSPAINAAIAFAATKLQNPKFYAPLGDYLINTTPTFPNKTTLVGDGPANTVFHAGMSDGTGVIKMASGCQNVTLADFSIIAPYAQTAFIAGGPAVNCIGLDTSDATTGHFTRFRIDNIAIEGCAVGWKHEGWIGRVSKMFITYCDLGARLWQFNAVSANLVTEACRQAMQMSGSYGFVFDGYLDEGDIAGALSSVLDECHGFTFTAPYWEWGSIHPRTTPFMTFGAAFPVSGFDISGATVSGSAGMAAGVAPLAFNICNGGGRVSGEFIVGAQLRSFSTTANTKGVEFVTVNRPLAAMADASLSQDAAVNYMPNSRFDNWYRGWSVTYGLRATVSQETTLVRRGANAARVTATAGQAYNLANWQVNGAIPTWLRGKTMRAGAWIWIPNIAGFDEAARTIYPNLYLMSFDGATATTAVSGNTNMMINAWNYVYAELQIQAASTQISVQAYVNDNASLAAGTEYVVVDSVTLCDASVPLQWQRDGMMRDSGLLPNYFNGIMQMSAAALPTDANQTYVAGDQVWVSAPAPSTSPGWICTTGGTGATAVWKTMAVLGA